MPRACRSPAGRGAWSCQSHKERDASRPKSAHFPWLVWSVGTSGGPIPLPESLSEGRVAGASHPRRRFWIADWCPRVIFLLSLRGRWSGVPATSSQGTPEPALTSRQLPLAVGVLMPRGPGVTLHESPYLAVPVPQANSQGSLVWRGMHTHFFAGFPS